MFVPSKRARSCRNTTSVGNDDSACENGTNGAGKRSRCNEETQVDVDSNVNDCPEIDLEPNRIFNLPGSKPSSSVDENKNENNNNKNDDSNNNNGDIIDNLCAAEEQSFPAPEDSSAIGLSVPILPDITHSRISTTAAALPALVYSEAADVGRCPDITATIITPRLLPTPDNISAALCKIDNRNNILGAHWAIDVICGWVAKSRNCNSVAARRCYESACCGTMKEFYELGGIQRLLRYVAFVNQKEDEEEEPTDDPSVTAQICYILVCCCLYRREYAMKIVALGGIESLIAVNERYVDNIVLSSPTPGTSTTTTSNTDTANTTCTNAGGSHTCRSSDRNYAEPQALSEDDRSPIQNMEWKSVLCIWTIFQSIARERIAEEYEQQQEHTWNNSCINYRNNIKTSDQMLDCALDTLESLHGVGEDEGCPNAFPNVMRYLFATLNHTLCPSTIQDPNQGNSGNGNRSFRYHECRRNCCCCTKLHRRVLFKCLRLMRDPITEDWRDFFPDDQEDHEITLLRSATRLLGGLVLMSNNKNNSDNSIVNGGVPSQECKAQHRDFQEVVRFGIEQIQKSPARALAGGAFCLIYRLCRTPREKDFVKRKTLLTAALGILLPMEGADLTLKRSCEKLLRHIYV